MSVEDQYRRRATGYTLKTNTVGGVGGVLQGRGVRGVAVEVKDEGGRHGSVDNGGREEK